MRKILFILSFLGFSFSHAGANSFFNKLFCGFEDVSVLNPYCFEIGWGKSENIIKGQTENSIEVFKPKNFLNRAGLIKIASRQDNNNKEEKDKENFDEEKKCSLNAYPFNDVPINDWYCHYVKYAFDNSWIKTANKFEPDRSISLAETLKVLILTHAENIHPNQPNIHTVHNNMTNEDLKFTDYEKENNPNNYPWYEDYINWAINNNLSLFKNLPINYNKKILREEVFSLSKEIEDLFTCNITKEQEEVIKSANSTYLKEQKPNCIEKALYYSYVKFGTKFLNDKTTWFNTKQKNINIAKETTDLIVKSIEDALDGVEGCSQQATKFKTNYLSKLKLLNYSVDENDIGFLAETFVSICYMDKVIPKKYIKIKTVIEKSLKVPEFLTTVVTDDFNHQIEIRKLSINVAFAFLGEYYTYGGDTKKLLEAYKKYGVSDIYSLITYIAKKTNNYTLAEEKREFFYDNDFNMELTQYYIEMVLSIVNEHYKEVM